MTRYTINVDSPVDIPDGVLREAVERAVKKLTKQYEPPKLNITVYRPRPSYAAGGFTGFQSGYRPHTADVSPLPVYRHPSHSPYSSPIYVANRASTGRSHPFEGPVVNDDLPLTEAEQQAVRTIGADFPRLQELIESRRPKRPKDAQPPAAEGDWQLPEDDGKVGTD